MEIKIKLVVVETKHETRVMSGCQKIQTRTKFKHFSQLSHDRESSDLRFKLCILCPDLNVQIYCKKMAKILYECFRCRPKKPCLNPLRPVLDSD